MDISTLTNETSGQLWMVAKWFYLLAFGIYIIFSVIVWRQIALMANTLKGKMELPLKALGLALMVVAVLAMIWAVMIL